MAKDVFDTSRSVTLRSFATAWKAIRYTHPNVERGNKGKDCGSIGA